jgi:hypothetical protein
VNGLIADGRVQVWLRGPPELWIEELGALVSDHGFTRLRCGVRETWPSRSLRHGVAPALGAA